MSRSRDLCLAVLSVIPALGCAHNPAPKAWQVPLLEAPSRPRGAWIELTLRDGPSKAIVAGELLAVDAERIHVLTAAGAVTTHRADVTKVAMGVHANQKSQTALWTVIGAISTASHGVYLALTAPLLWGLAGGLVVASESHTGVVESLAGARKYARFPQGLPPGLDLASMPPLAGMAAVR